MVMISTDLCDKKKFTENLMSQTCPVTLFGGIKKGLPNLKALVLSGAGTKSRTRDLLITSQLFTKNHMSSYVIILPHKTLLINYFVSKKTYI